MVCVWCVGVASWLGVRCVVRMCGEVLDAWKGSYLWCGL